MAFGLMAMLSDARKPSRFSQDRIQQIWTKMERHYGKGLVGMFHPVTGRFDINRVGWGQHGRRLGESLSYEIVPGLTVDATTTFSMLLGAAQGTQWSGLNADSKSA